MFSMQQAERITHKDGRDFLWFTQSETSYQFPNIRVNGYRWCSGDAIDAHILNPRRKQDGEVSAHLALEKTV